MPHIGSSHNIRLVVCSLQIGQWSQVAAVLSRNPKGERKRIVTELTLAPEQRKDRRKRTRVERLRRRLDLHGGAPRVWNYSWTHFGNENEVLSTWGNKHERWEKRCVHSVVRLFSQRREGRAYTYTHTSDKRVVCVCVCVGTSQSDSYLVDSASSHMLVSKIKPCMSKYKHVILWNCEWLIKSVIVYLMVFATWITVVILELIHAYKPRLLEGVYLLDKNQHCWWIMITSRIAWPRAGDTSFKYLPYQLSMVG